MGFDRDYFVDTREGFTSRWKKCGDKDGSALFKRAYTVKEGGDYFLQYFTVPENAGINVLSPTARYTPILHGEDKEFILELNCGENEITVALPADSDENTLHTRLFAADGTLLRDDEYYPCPDAEDLPDFKFTEIPEGYTPAVGKGFRSFGRFGFAKGDGVLDYSMPAFGIVSRPFVSGVPRYKKHAMWSFSVLPDGESESGRNMKKYTVPPNEKLEVDWTHTRWRRELDGGHYISYDYSTIASSLLIESDLDYLKLSRMGAIGAPASATFCAEGCGDGFVTKTPCDGVLYSLERDGMLKKNFVLLTRQGRFPEVPMLLTLPRSPKSIIRNDHSIRVEFDGAMDFAMLTFLYGIEMLDTVDLTEKWYESAIKKAVRVHSMSLSRAVLCEEYFKIDGEKVKIFERFEFKNFADSLKTPTLSASPLPPPVMLEALYGGCAVADADCEDIGLPTKYGPLYAVIGRDSAEYTLPIPEYREKLPFCAEHKAKFAQMLHSDFAEYISFHRDKGYIPNPGNYSFLFQYAYVYKLFPYLLDCDKAKLEEIMREGIDVICNPDYGYIGPNERRCLSWYRRTEPFTGISYLSTYLHVTGISQYAHCDREIIENSENVFIELDWGNGMSLYATWLSALFTDGFEKLDSSFHIIKGAFDYYLNGMDFACMSVGYAENGVSWNDGTNYGGYLGFINISEALGRKDEAELGKYAFAKLGCLRRAMLLSTQNYFCKHFGAEPWYAAKFFHEETDGDCAFISNPHSMIRNGYRKESLYNLSTEGHYREAFGMYAKYLPRQTEELLRKAEGSVIGSITEKRADGENAYSTLKSGFLGEQETFTYLSLSTMLRRFDAEALERMINEAAENHRISREMLGHYVWSNRRVPKEWSRISLLCGLYARDTENLTAWRGLRISDAEYPVIKVTDVKEGAWLEVWSDDMPNATFNGNALPFKKLRDGIYRAEIPCDGAVKFG